MLDEEYPYLLSMSDLMAGMLFLFIIALVAARQFTSEVELKADRLAEEKRRLSEQVELRARLLKELANELNTTVLPVEADVRTGVLRVRAESLFESASDTPLDDKVEALRRIADRLYESLAQASWDSLSLESVTIEGHADWTPVSQKTAEERRFRDNWDLSALRATQVYRVLAERQPGLLLLKNRASVPQPLLGVAGYGDQRRLPGRLADEEKDKERHRRIEIRFILRAPEGTSSG